MSQTHAGSGRAPGGDRPRLRLEFLDGLRGMAALYVVLFHAGQIALGYADGEYHAVGPWGAGPASQALLRFIRAAYFMVLGHGREAVTVFIVLSGYCLMLPVVLAGRDDLGGGVGTFLRRRAWRILPPYYAAIAATMLLVALIPGLRVHADVYWDSSLPVFAAVPIITHLLLVQSWGPWALTINGPLWSVAVEVQIYLLFPALLLPLRRRLGSLGMAAVAFAGGVGLFQFVRQWVNAPFMKPWYAGAFAMGVFAASVGFSGRARETRWRDRLPWGALAAAFALVSAFLIVASRKRWERVEGLYYFREPAWGSAWPMDLAVALTIACLIVWLSRQAIGRRPAGRLLRLFSARRAAALGAFSYSLYLVHSPVLGAVDWFARARFRPEVAALFPFVGAVASVGIAYGFYLAFEAPFLRRRDRKAVAAGAGVALDLSPPAVHAAAPAAGPPPRVSVIIPCYQAARFVRRALESVFAQALPASEVIVVDDASPADDGLVAALAPYAGRITLVTHPANAGLSAARNSGAAAASGDVLAFLDPDDWWPADLLARLAPLVAPGRAVGYDNFRIPEARLPRPDPGTCPIAPGAGDGAGGGTEDHAGTLLGEWLRVAPNPLTRDDMLAVFTVPSLFKVLVHREDCAAAGGFDPRYFGIEDFHFYVKLLARGVRLDVRPEPKGFYLVREGSILRSIEQDAARNARTLRAKWRMFDDLPREVPLPADAAAECRRLRGYYRARFVDALVKASLRARSVSGLMSAGFLGTAFLAAPGIVAFKARGAGARIRSRVGRLAGKFGGRAKAAPAATGGKD